MLRKCREPGADSRNMRRVFVSDHRPLVDQARAYAATPQYKAELRGRGLVERIIAVVTRYDYEQRTRRFDPTNFG